MEKIPTDQVHKAVERFVFDWHRFFIDYWWRKKYKIPFGSSQHREMNFIDMLIEYKEDFLVSQYIEDKEKEEDEELGIEDTGNESMTEEEIDEAYDNLDLNDITL